MDRAQFIGDSPQARFGHTITPISKDKAILFGGAVGDTGKYIITGDTFLCDFSLKKWKKLENHGMQPTNRAAHNSLTVDHFFFVFGGALGGGELADDSLYQLDFLTLTDKAYWSVKNCKGTTPGSRYGHVMAYLKPCIILYGGNTGTEAVGDIWRIDVLGNSIWQKVVTGMQSPPPRVYHSASICRTGTASGMMVIFGGRGTDGVPMNDTWGLRKHRDGRLDWMKAPYRNSSKPAERYQHRSIFIGTLMLVIGGRNNSVGESMPLDIYDTDSSDWYKLPNIDRFRHACFLIDHYIYIHGGFDQEAPNIPTQSTLRFDLNKAFSSFPPLFKGLAFELGKDVFTVNHINNPKLRGSKDHQQERRTQQGYRQIMYVQSKRTISNHPLKSLFDKEMPIQKSIIICPEAIVANYDDQCDIKKIHIDNLPTEHRRLIGNTTIGNSIDHIEKISRFFLNALFLRAVSHLTFPIPSQSIDKLLDMVEKTFDQEPTLMRIRLPVKIFGDIHGQFQELNRNFQAFGAPTDEPPYGDIQYTNYLFLGDYIDRGSKGLQTILLLFALKIKHPENIVLLRGSHQDKLINRYMGFGDECAQKFKENIDDPNSYFNRINKIFEKMPIAALIQDNIFCSHGGIGHTLKFIPEIQKISKPIKINHEPKTRNQKIIYELLWTDPCKIEEPQFTLNIQHDYFLNKNNNKFSDERATNFCNENDIMTIVRSHEPYMQGYDSRESIITVFSCSDYGGKNNKSSILHIQKSGQIVPKILKPLSNTKDRWLNLQDQKTKFSSNQQNKLRQLTFTPPKK